MLYIILNVFLIWLGFNSKYGNYILAGEASNGIAFVSNGFTMPAFGGTYNDAFHSRLSPKTNLPFLCDDFYFAIDEPFYNFSFSIGDVLILYGLIKDYF